MRRNDSLDDRKLENERQLKKSMIKQLCLYDLNTCGKLYEKLTDNFNKSISSKRSRDSFVDKALENSKKIQAFYHDFMKNHLGSDNENDQNEQATNSNQQDEDYSVQVVGSHHDDESESYSDYSIEELSDNNELSINSEVYLYLL